MSGCFDDLHEMIVPGAAPHASARSRSRPGPVMLALRTLCQLFHGRRKLNAVEEEVDARDAVAAEGEKLHSRYGAGRGVRHKIVDDASLVTFSEGGADRAAFPNWRHALQRGE